MNCPDRSESDPTALYLNLIKRCLADMVYISDPFMNYGPYRPREDRAQWKERILGTIDRALRPHHMRIFEAQSTRNTAETIEQRTGGRVWPFRAHTMIGLKRLEDFQYCVETAIKEGIPGDLIETGVWRGGACIFMRAILKAYGEESRTVWVADSFAGLPPPDAQNYPADAGDILHTHDVLAIPRETVARNFEAYDLLDDQVRFLQGWFKDTLPNAPIKQLAVMRLDGDLYRVRRFRRWTRFTTGFLQVGSSLSTTTS